VRFVGLKRILSYLFIIPEYRFQSMLSGLMDIRWEQGRLALNSANANYSYNHLHKVMQAGLACVMEHALPAGPILNLGMGAGSTVSILREELKLNNKITSVEYDKDLIEIAKQYFNLDCFTSHTVVCADAYDFVEETKEEYALIIIDLFKDREVNQRFQSPAFAKICSNLLLKGGALLFNYIGGESHPFEGLLPKGNTEVLEIGENQVLIYRKTERS
jgi:spermidine synthase